jgi:hypothetical protein
MDAHPNPQTLAAPALLLGCCCCAPALLPVLLALPLPLLLLLLDGRHPRLLLLLLHQHPRQLLLPLLHRLLTPALPSCPLLLVRAASGHQSCSNSNATVDIWNVKPEKRYSAEHLLCTSVTCAGKRSGYTLHGQLRCSRLTVRTNTCIAYNGNQLQDTVH